MKLLKSRGRALRELLKLKLNNSKRESIVSLSCLKPKKKPEKVGSQGLKKNKMNILRPTKICCKLKVTTKTKCWPPKTQRFKFKLSTDKLKS